MQAGLKDYLKVATAEQKVDFDVLNLLHVLESSVDIVEVTVHATFHCDPHVAASSSSSPEETILNLSM